MTMISFPRRDRANIPVELLSFEEGKLFQREGCIIKDDEELGLHLYQVNTLYCPQILYSKRKVPFYGSEIPLYIQILLAVPTQRMRHNQSEEELNKQKDLEAVRQFTEDLNNFPYQRFSEALLDLQELPLAYDKKEEADGMCKFNPNYIIFGKRATEISYDVESLTGILLHELFHFAELELGDEVKELLKYNERWDCFRITDLILPDPRYEEVRRIKYHGFNTYKIHWSNGERESRHDCLAELLTALTFVEHPEIKKSVVDRYGKYYLPENPQLSFQF